MFRPITASAHKKATEVSVRLLFVPNLRGIVADRILYRPSQHCLIEYANNFLILQPQPNKISVVIDC